jgi:sec-independent protein translocase protein TatB
MFDIAPTELLIVAVVALIVIGPKDLPKVMRTVGEWVGRARGMARHFRSGIDTMIREAELEDMEKKWQAENDRIMGGTMPASDIASLPPLPVPTPAPSPASSPTAGTIAAPRPDNDFPGPGSSSDPTSGSPESKIASGDPAPDTSARPVERPRDLP